MPKEIEFIKETLEEMSAFVRERYADRTDLQVSSKADPNDMLTEVDLAVQQQTSERLKQVFPEDLFLGEENDMWQPPTTPDRRSWIMDPIDGTQNFIRGLFPYFAIALAHVRGNEVVAGGVSLPIMGHLFLAEKGSGATRNDQPIKVSDVQHLSVARIEVDFGPCHIREDMLRVAGPIVVKAGAVRCNCAAVVGLCQIASGDLDGYIHTDLAPWDWAAGQVILEEAGGRMSTLDGAPLRPFDPRKGVAAANSAIFDELLQTAKPL